MSLRRNIASILLMAVFAHPGPARAVGVNVAVTPSTQTVPPGTDFTLNLTVTSAGSNFNGYDAIISYDPAVLTFLPTAPTSLQQGSYMTSACGNTFHLFSAAGDSLKINHVLLCSGVSLPGPGQLYTLRFHASNTPQITQVRIRSAQFYNAGLFVNPANTSDATIGIGVVVGVDPEDPATGRLSVRATPNPARGLTMLTLVSPRGGEHRLDVTDLAGRVVRHLESGSFAAGARRVEWDGRDDSGRMLPAGVYRVLLREQAHAATTRVTLLR